MPTLLDTFFISGESEKVYEDTSQLFHYKTVRWSSDCQLYDCQLYDSQSYDS